MQHSVFNTLARSIETALLNAVARSMSGDELGQSALVVAPHADDETLGCGGTIMKKIAVSAAVSVLFVTDGGGSNKSLPRDELVRRRKSEALAACDVLGVGPENITFLDLPDGRLEHDGQAIVRGVQDAMNKCNPAQVFVPYRHDNHPDHLATNRAVIEAIRRGGAMRVVYEYPIWFWEHWPWMSLPRDYPHRARRGLKRAILSPMHGLRDLHTFVDVSDVLDRKRAALDHHATQMQSPGGKWDTLPMIEDGEFLARLLRDREVFAMRVIRP